MDTTTEAVTLRADMMEVVAAAHKKRAECCGQVCSAGVCAAPACHFGDVMRGLQDGAATLRALAQERDAAFRRGMLHACDIACDVMQRATKCAREPDLIPNIRREFLAQARGIEDAVDAIRRASEGGKNA